MNINSIKDILISSVPTTKELVVKVLKGVQIAAVSQIVNKHVMRLLKNQLLTKDDIEYQEVLSQYVESVQNKQKFMNEHLNNSDIQKEEK